MNKPLKQQLQKKKFCTNEQLEEKKAEVEARYVEFQGKSSEELKDIARSGSSYSGMARKILQDRGEL